MSTLRKPKAVTTPSSKQKPTKWKNGVNPDVDWSNVIGMCECGHAQDEHRGIPEQDIKGFLECEHKDGRGKCRCHRYTWVGWKKGHEPKHKENSSASVD